MIRYFALLSITLLACQTKPFFKEGHQFMKFEESRARHYVLHNESEPSSMYFLAINKYPDVLFGESTFKLDSSYAFDQQVSQYAYFVFFQDGYVYYNTEFMNDIRLDGLIMAMPDHIVIDRYENEHNCNALLGQYRVEEDDRICMDMYRRNGEREVRFYGYIEEDNLHLEVAEVKRIKGLDKPDDQVSDTTITIPDPTEPLEIDTTIRNYRKFYLDGMFSVEKILFKRVPNEHPELICPVCPKR